MVVTVTGLRGAVQGLANGASAGVREQLHQLLAEDVDPLIDKANAVLEGRITQAADEAVRVLAVARTEMLTVISAGQQATSALVEQARHAIAQEIDHLDATLQHALCNVAPEGRGIMIVLPILGSGAGTVRVARPKRTQCYHTYFQSQSDPASATFSGFEYYEGELCEAELSLSRLDPEDPYSVEVMANAYAHLAALAKRGICSMPTSEKRSSLQSREAEYELRSAFFAGLAKYGPLSVH